MTPDTPRSLLPPPRCVAVFSGPSPWAREPVLVAELQTGGSDWGRLDEGCRRLRARWPDWFAVAPGEAAGTDTQPAGTDPDAAAAVRVGACLAAWARGALNAMRGDVSEAGALVLRPSLLRFWVGYHLPSLAWRAAKLAVEVAGRAAISGPAGIDWAERALHAFCKQAGNLHPDRQMIFVLQAARVRGVPFLSPAGTTRAWQFGHGARSRLFYEAASNADGMVGVMLAANKAHSKQFMAALGVPVAPDIVLSDPAALGEAVRAIGWPCAVKPIDSGRGRGVTADVRDEKGLKAAFDHAQQHTRGPVMIERHIEGDDHRLLVLGGRFVSCVRRRPASVVGDGRRSLRALIDALNAARLTDSDYLKPVLEDEAFDRHLASLGLRLDSVPAPGRQVRLRSISNVSTGGELDFLTDRVHPALVKLVEAVARACGMSSLGFDYVTTDVGLHWRQSGGCFIEINETPGLDGLDRHPGKPAGWLGEALFGSDIGRIPLACAVVPAADWSEWRAWLVSLDDMPGLGLAGPGLARACGVDWQADAMSASETAAAVLRQRGVTRALLVTTDTALQTGGYPADRFETIALAGGGLPRAWVETGRRIAARFEHHAGAGDARAALATWCRANGPT